MGMAAGKHRFHVLWVVLIWLGLTIAGEALVLSVGLLPAAAADEATIADNAFQVLVLLAVPVFAFVVATLLYSVGRFRSRGQPNGDGPPVTARPLVVGGWLAVTGALAMYIEVNPGQLGLAALRTHHEPPDLVVQVEGSQWQWKVSYPRYGVTSKDELVLPRGAHVRFDITSVDVVHAFWIPAFRVKIDAVPGRLTTAYATPNRLITTEVDHDARLVCSELCGLGHALMNTPIRVVEPAAFDGWIATTRAAADGSPVTALAPADQTTVALVIGSADQGHTHAAAPAGLASSPVSRVLAVLTGAADPVR